MAAATWPRSPIRKLHDRKRDPVLPHGLHDAACVVFTKQGGEREQHEAEAQADEPEPTRLHVLGGRLGDCFRDLRSELVSDRRQLCPDPCTPSGLASMRLLVARRRLLFGCRGLGPPKRRELVSLEGLARRREGARRYRGRRRCRIELFLRREAAGEAESGTAILLPRSRARPLSRGPPRRARADT